MYHAPNRTIVELKLFTFPAVGFHEINSQSHHSGIEIPSLHRSILNKGTPNRTIVELKLSNTYYRKHRRNDSQSHHSGIEIGEINTFVNKKVCTPNRTIVELKCTIKDELVDSPASQSHHSGIEMKTSLTS